MTHQTVSGAVLTPASRTRLNHGSTTRGSAVFMDSPLPLRSPAVSLRFLLRRGIGAPVHDRGANATRDFSERSGAFRSEHSFVPVCPSHFTHRDMAQRVLGSERSQTLVPFSVPDVPVMSAENRKGCPTRVATTFALKEAQPLQDVVQKSEIAAGRAIGPSRRPNNIVAFPVARDHAAGD